MGKSTRFAIERNQTLPHRGTISDQQSKSLAEPNQTKPKPPTKLGAEKLTPEEQRRRFEELAHEAGCDEDSDARFEVAMKTIGKRGATRTADWAKRSESEENSS